jgi:hypothetical protein
MIDYATILIRKYKGSEWILNGDDYEGLNWLSNTTKPTKKELDDLWSVVKDEIKAEAEAKVQAKAIAEAKLAALGLTTEDLRALGL